MILEKINYQEHRLMVCGDFKMLTMLLGQQAGCTKYPCYYACGTVEPDTSIGPKLSGRFKKQLGGNDKETWDSFKDVVHRVLENTKDPLYKTIVQHMLAAYEARGCKMSLKVHFLHSHIDYFQENLGAYSEEQSERFHQDARDIERRYQGRWDVNMLADYCWMLRQETEDGKRKRVRRSVKEKK
ncbi:hypothetical protein AVEN_43807-1 [Araneus ventricosus]|uniref:Uncharacterized protein n=1 Tax=Araneus ventricosus TaxID=182803 RepID=A0A4Y2LI97_ARAVE|nr:hypothetical protein AVEN_43807-1 [Araneus ventricosus]